MVNNIAIFFFLFIIRVESICPNIAHHIDTIIITIHFVGSLFITSTPISSIFCHTAVETARKIPIGIKNVKYFFIDQKMFGMFFVIALCSVCFLKLLSYVVKRIRVVAIVTVSINHIAPTHCKRS
jgi:hypothetical protein